MVFWLNVLHSLEDRMQQGFQNYGHAALLPPLQDTICYAKAPILSPYTSTDVYMSKEHTLHPIVATNGVTNMSETWDRLPLVLHPFDALLLGRGDLTSFWTLLRFLPCSSSPLLPPPCPHFPLHPGTPSVLPLLPPSLPKLGHLSPSYGGLHTLHT